MLLGTIDWTIVFIYFIISLAIGLWMARNNNTDSKDFFTASGKMPWWLLGVSMVATTFSTDTPNLVTDIVRKHGVSGNWVWWIFLLTGMLTVFVYAKLWKKSGVLTDVEFYELRYSGPLARFLRGFRAIYLGLVFNVMIMATVSLAAIKIGGILLGLTPVQTILIAGTVTVIYSSLGGLRGVLVTDFIQFFLSISGALAAAYVALNHPRVNGLSNLLQHEAVRDKLDLIPSFSEPELFISILLIPLLIQWWSVWYPGAEPGGGGYVAQRMFAAKNEDHALKSVLLFNVAHYVLRPWPWIIVALCSLVVFPSLDSIRLAFPDATSVIDHDIAYPAMLTFLPTGILGLVVTSLIAAYMSTISTHLNWGASYLVNDVYKRFVKPESSEKELIQIGRITTVVLMALAMLFALGLSSALDAFQILLQIGAGTGLIFILRWFWWRVNAASEIAAMTISFLIAIYFHFVHVKLFGFAVLEGWEQLTIGVIITTLGWILVSYVTKPTDRKTMINFINKVNPGGPGWHKIVQQLANSGEVIDNTNEHWKVPIGIRCMLLGTVGTYSLLLGSGLFIYSDFLKGTCLFILATICYFLLSKYWKRI